jgi:hypothetical protein
MFDGGPSLPVSATGSEGPKRWSHGVDVEEEEDGHTQTGGIGGGGGGRGGESDDMKR